MASDNAKSVLSDYLCRPGTGLLILLSVLATVWLLLHAAETAEAEPEFRALWVDGFHVGIRSEAEVTHLIADAKRANVNTLIVQVRRRGDALYAKSFEPPVEDPAYRGTFDGLAAVLDAAHKVSRAELRKLQ